MNVFINTHIINTYEQCCIYTRIHTPTLTHKHAYTVYNTRMRTRHYISVCARVYRRRLRNNVTIDAVTCSNT